MNNLFNLREPYRTYGVVATIMLSFYAVWFSPSIARADYTLTTTTTNNNIGTMGNSTTHRRATKVDIATSGTIQSGTVGLGVASSPPATWHLSVYTDSAGTVGTLLDSTADTTAPAIDCVDDATNDASVAFSAPVALDAGQSYWFVSERSDALDTGGSFRICGDGASGTQKRDTGSWGGDDSGEQRLQFDVVTGGGGGGGGATTSTTTITYIDNPTQDLFNGFVIFFMVFLGTVWLLRKKS